MEIFFATSNKNKLKEATSILGREIKSASLEIPEIQSVSVEEVVREKASGAFKLIKSPVIVEDTGLYIESFNNLPGAMVKWFEKSLGYQKICDIVGENRAAYAETAVCFDDGNKSIVFTGRLNGSITTEPVGSNGFGWDAIFRPEGLERTLAEMELEEKNKISHRSQAFSKLRKYLIEEGL